MELYNYVQEWSTPFYTGCVLQAPGYTDVLKFREHATLAFEKHMYENMPENLPEGVSEEDHKKALLKEFENQLQDEIELKMLPFRESHPNGTFKHHCGLLLCEVMVFYDFMTCKHLYVSKIYFGNLIIVFCIQEWISTGRQCKKCGDTLVYGQKTVPLNEYLVKRYTTAQGQLVMDPFMGSGKSFHLKLKSLRLSYLCMHSNDSFIFYRLGGHCCATSSSLLLGI